MRKTLHGIPLILMVCGAVWAGPELDRARRNTALARAVLDAAERRLTESKAEEDRIRIEMDRARDKQGEIDRRIDRLRDFQRDVPAMVRDEEAKLPKLNGDVDAAAAGLVKAQEPLRGLIDKAKATLAAVKELRTKYVRQFEASDPYRNALATAEIAAKNLAAANQGALAKVRGTAAHKKAVAEHDAAKLNMAAIKRDPEAEVSARTAAANRVIQTESVIVKLETDALADDEALTAAKADVLKAEQTLREVVEQFERDVPKQPDMADALVKHDAAQKAAEAADAAVIRAETKLMAANTFLDLAKSKIAELKEKLARAELEIAAAQREDDAISRELDAMSKRLADSATQVARNQREVDAADRRYRDARAYEIIAARIDAQNEKNKDKKGL